MTATAFDETRRRDDVFRSDLPTKAKDIKAVLANCFDDGFPNGWTEVVIVVNVAKNYKSFVPTKINVYKSNGKFKFNGIALQRGGLKSYGSLESLLKDARNIFGKKAYMKLAINYADTETPTE